MRMWMVDPKLLCTHHLNMEHCDLHKLVVHLRRGRRVDGCLLKQLVDPSSIFERHRVLEQEIQLRGGRTCSPLSEQECRSFGHWHGSVAIDVGRALSDLAGRCVDCGARIRTFVYVKLSTPRATAFIPW